MVKKLLLMKNEIFGCHGKRIFIGLPKSTLLQVTLTIQRSSKINISDNTFNFSKLEKVNITSSNMNFCQNQGYGTYC